MKAALISQILTDFLFPSFFDYRELQLPTLLWISLSPLSISLCFALHILKVLFVFHTHSELYFDSLTSYLNVMSLFSPDSTVQVYFGRYWFKLIFA